MVANNKNPLCLVSIDRNGLKGYQITHRIKGKSQKEARTKGRGRGGRWLQGHPNSHRGTNLAGMPWLLLLDQNHCYSLHHQCWHEVSGVSYTSTSFSPEAKSQWKHLVDQGGGGQVFVQKEYPKPWLLCPKHKMSLDTLSCSQINKCPLKPLNTVWY